MRSNRSSYHAAPAGSARALGQKPKPKKSKREINQIMLMVFFIVLPVLGLIAIFFQPVRWIFMLCVVAAILAMWLVRAFLFPGRMMLSAVYGLLLIFTLVTALGSDTGRGINQQTNAFNIPTASPETTPLFSYSMMGTDVPDGYYDDLGDETPDGGEDDLIGDSDDTVTGAYSPDVKSDAEIALENFMEKWRKGIIADMVEYTAPSWQSQQDSPSRQLFWKFAQKPLEDWRQISSPSGTEASTARTIQIQADVSYGGETRTYAYDAVVLYENEKWYVDPNSLSTGTLVEAATPTPDPNATPTPTPEPTPTPTINPKTTLYYNKDGGKLYHADKNCSKVASQYLPLTGTFTYSQINDSPYNKLEPCDRCNPPERP